MFGIQAFCEYCLLQTGSQTKQVWSVTLHTPHGNEGFLVIKDIIFFVCLRKQGNVLATKTPPI